MRRIKRYHKRHLALTGSNRGDRHNRDILINSDFLGIQGTAEYLEDLIAKNTEKGGLTYGTETSEFDKVLGAWDILVIAFGAMIGLGAG